jgi:hypothetical protein
VPEAAKEVEAADPTTEPSAHPVTDLVECPEVDAGPDTSTDAFGSTRADWARLTDWAVLWSRNGKWRQ